ncbi:MAG: rhamnulokinase [Bacteroidaceae bacterium]|nr:rhamnulokinase [Bacteroidaceae bacterium]
MKNYLAVDLGATSGRTILATFDGEKVEMKEWTRFDNPQIPMAGHVFWDLPYLYNEILKSLKKVAEQRVKIESIGIDTWGCDFAFFGKQGQLVGMPFCYRDPHTDGSIEAFTRVHMNAEALYKNTGIQFMPFNSLFQLDTMRRTGITALNAADKVMFIPDALSYLLTGKCICEYTVASTSQMLNPKTGDLDERLLRFVNLSRKNFGPMTMPGTLIGTLAEQVKRATGLGDIPVVAVAGHDTASAVASVPAQDKNYAYLSCGTWSLLGIESETPIITEESRKQNFTNEGGVDGTTRFLKNICGMWLLEQSRKDFKKVPKNVGELSALCLESQYDGLINPDDEMFAHPEKMTQAIDEYCRQTRQDKPETPADYIRCIFRSLALRYRQVIELLRNLSDVKIEHLHVIGGGSLNVYLMQMAADATGLPVIAGPTEGTALGNVLLQIRAGGDVQSLTDMRAISARSVETVTYQPNQTPEWEEAYEKFKQLR